MILILAVTIVCTLFILLDLVPIYRNKQWWEFWVYLTMIAVVYVLILFIAAGVKIPSPAVPLKKIVSVILGI